MMKTKIILDTDIGSDVDDAVCLAYLLANPQCDLLGITTVTGEPVQRAQMASAMCKIAGREDIPIYPGAADPIIVPQKQVKAPQAAALDHWPHQKDFPQGQAVEFLRRTIRENPGEVTLLAVGPLTNIGLLFKVDPEIPALLKGLVLMCGLFSNRVPGFGPLEWNAIGDPHASAVVYNAPVKVHRSVGLDVTTKIVMRADEVRQRFTSPLLRPVLDFAEVWFKQYDHIMFHDPLAAAVIFNDKICPFERGRVDVELASPHLAGYTAWTAAADGPHEVAFQIDAGCFFDEYFSVVK
jgi:inosine-uridine nucleoside N-ribohydrolase